MCLCKLKPLAVFVSFFYLCNLVACKPEVAGSNGKPKFFGIKEYFTNEARRLTALKPKVIKTVSYNGKHESKSISINNWLREFSFFLESDINKPSWKDSYSVKTNPDSIVYNAVDTTLYTRKLVVNLNGGKVVSIMILNRTKNLLYKEKEELLYYPDSVYLISKVQHTIFLGTNNYNISGKLR
jgi:hypothetical protein